MERTLMSRPKFLKRAAPAPVQPELRAGPVPKKIKHEHVGDHARYYKPKWDVQRAQRKDGAKLDQGDIEDMLTRSITFALGAVGFEAAEPEAVESLRMDTEEYMAHYLADVRQSMLSSRRMQATPEDFLQALHTHQLSLHSLQPHLTPPIPPKRSQYPLQTDGPDDGTQERQLLLLGPLLNSGVDQTVKKFIPKHFPGLPSKHTYKETAEFSEREQDPRKIRERATEEGRLGEEALRKLVGQAAAHPAAEALQKGKKQTAREKRDQMWRETMAAVAQGDSNTADGDTAMGGVEKGKQQEGQPVSLVFCGHVGSAVNYEKKYWRKPAK